MSKGRKRHLYSPETKAEEIRELKEQLSQALEIIQKQQKQIERLQQIVEQQRAEIEDLDPAIFGVIVEDESGSRRGLLLPALEGIDTVEKQVEIAARKAGIAPGRPLRLMRFKVSRYSESWLR